MEVHRVVRAQATRDCRRCCLIRHSIPFWNSINCFQINIYNTLGSLYFIMYIFCIYLCMYFVCGEYLCIICSHNIKEIFKKRIIRWSVVGNSGFLSVEAITWVKNYDILIKIGVLWHCKDVRSRWVKSTILTLTNPSHHR